VKRIWDKMRTYWEHVGNPIENFYENTMSISWELHLGGGGRGGGGGLFRVLKGAFGRNGFPYIHLSF